MIQRNLNTAVYCRFKVDFRKTTVDLTLSAIQLHASVDMNTNLTHCFLLFHPRHRHYDKLTILCEGYSGG